MEFPCSKGDASLDEEAPVIFSRYLISSYFKPQLGLTNVCCAQNRSEKKEKKNPSIVADGSPTLSVSGLMQVREYLSNGVNQEHLKNIPEINYRGGVVAGITECIIAV